METEDGFSKPLGSVCHPICPPLSSLSPPPVHHLLLLLGCPLTVTVGPAKCQSHAKHARGFQTVNQPAWLHEGRMCERYNRRTVWTDWAAAPLMYLIRNMLHGEGPAGVIGPVCSEVERCSFKRDPSLHAAVSNHLAHHEGDVESTSAVTQLLKPATESPSLVWPPLTNSLLSDKASASDYLCLEKTGEGVKRRGTLTVYSTCNSGHLVCTYEVSIKLLLHSKTKSR